MLDIRQPHDIKIAVNKYKRDYTLVLAQIIVSSLEGPDSLSLCI